MIFLDRDHNAIEFAESLYANLSRKYEISFLRSSPDLSYPLIAKKMADLILANPGSLGILICQTGIGMSIVSNKYKGVFANNCKSEEECFCFKSKNHGNVLCLGAKIISVAEAIKICNVFLSTEFDVRTQNRIDLIMQLDSNTFSNHMG